MIFTDVTIEEITNEGKVLHSQCICSDRTVFGLLGFFYDCLYNPFENEVAFIRITYDYLDKEKEVFILSKEREEKIKCKTEKQEKNLIELQ